MIFFFFFTVSESQSTNQVQDVSSVASLETDLLFCSFFPPMTIFPSRMEGKIAINLRERWKNENSIGISVNKGFALLRSLVTTLPLFLDKVTFRVISPSISPQEI